jgi:acyl-coenzyme A thioesterase PaaI-like protein
MVAIIVTAYVIQLTTIARRSRRMNVIELPFNRLIGLERAAAESGFLLSLPDAAKYQNHLGTVHAGALLALAEAASGDFLLRQSDNGPSVLPVVRRLEAKFHKPAQGRVAARATADAGELAKLAADLQTRGRGLVKVNVELVDEKGVVVVSAEVQWFIARRAGHR